MPKVDQATYEGRKERVFLALRRHQAGLSEADLEQVTGIQRRSLNNYLRALEIEGKVYKDGITWAALPYDQVQLRKFDLSPEEGMTLYLAARLFVKQHDKRNEPAETALMKLASVLTADAGVGSEIHQAAQELSHRPDNSNYTQVFRTVMQAYIYRHTLRITYEPTTARPFETDFSPYLLEPSAIGFTTYAIGHSSIVNAWRTYKLERIRSAALTRQEYQIPADFPGLDILRTAWSIIYGEELVTVKLRFGLAVRQRVLETRWHPSEEKRDDPEQPGYLLWTAQVADTTDMLPWIRAWGADVEVLEPKALRDALVREARKMAELYKVMEVKKQFIAHIREKDKERQSLIEHLSAVSRLSGQFAQKIGLKETGELLGLSHDFGKASDKFQNYLLSGEGEINPDADGYIDPQAMRGKIDHSTAGAQAIYEKLWSKGSKEKVAAQVLALCIASHHSGLIDCLAPDGENNFKRRMEKADGDTHKTEALSNLQELQSAIEGLLSQDVAEQIFAKLESLQEQNGDSKPNLAFKAGLLIRFLLSCLIDADRLDTADFETPGNARIRNYGKYHPWETLIERLDNKLREFANKRNKNEVDQLRAQVSQACFDFATKPEGIYQLTVPTGGGKTLASLRFALKHAKEHSMDRVIYVIPYTSIIDQNAEEIRKILEDKDESGKYLDRVVLEHHSNLTPEEESRRQNLLAQNWDAPVVFTTQVQLLEALFGAGTRSVRRMHQLANSVIILDEVQTIPINTIHMLNLALRFLVHTCGATVVLCTATQPPLDRLENPYRALIINPEQRIIQNEKELFERLKRVEVFDKRKVGGWSDEEVAELAAGQLQEKGSALIVVNTKKSARALHRAIADRRIAGVHLYHLSTNMCPAHRLNVLTEIKEKLKPEKEERVICVSTQLIEAGVDIDFGAVIRYLAGLDSIAQSAGRCNRHGVREGFGNVWIVNAKEENIEKLKTIQIGAEKAQRVLDDFGKKPEEFGNERIGLNAMAAYYKYYYYERSGEMEYKVGVKSSAGQDDTLFNLLSVNSQAMKTYQRVNQAAPDLVILQSFKTAAKEFRVIDSPTRGVVAQYGDEGKEIVADLCGAPELEKQYKLLKRAQRYSVNLFPHEFEKLARMGVIQEVQQGTGVFYLDDRYYSKDFGWSDEPVNDMKLQMA